MATRIRLTRMGRRNRPYFRMVVADSRARRDGKYIEWVGSYDPMKGKAERVTLKEDRIMEWLKNGAEPSETVKNILSDAGIMLKFHLDNPKISEDQRNMQLQKYELSKKAASPAVEKSPRAEEAKPETTLSEPESAEASAVSEQDE